MLFIIVLEEDDIGLLVVNSEVIYGVMILLINKEFVIIVGVYVFKGNWWVKRKLISVRMRLIKIYCIKLIFIMLF